MENEQEIVNGELPPEEQVESAMEINLIGILSIIVASKRLFLISWVSLMLLAVIGLKLIDPKYTASIEVAPSSVSSEGASSSLSGLSGIASLAGVSLPEDESLSAFSEFKETLISRRLARELMKTEEILPTLFSQHWDNDKSRWKSKPGVTGQITSAIASFFGLPGWTPPTTSDLIEVLEKDVNISSKSTSPTLSISFDFKDPEFALRFISLIHQVSDGIVRNSILERTNAQLEYLKTQLQTVTIAEHRQALVQLLISQEQKLMMLSTDQPYAARVVELPHVSEKPTSPRPLLTLIIVGIAGFFISGFLIFVREFWRSLRASLREP